MFGSLSGKCMLPLVSLSKQSKVKAFLECAGRLSFGCPRVLGACTLGHELVGLSNEGLFVMWLWRRSILGGIRRLAMSFMEF